MAGNRIENFTKTPLFSGSTQKGPSSIEQVKTKANQERKAFQTTSVIEALTHNQDTSWVVLIFLILTKAFLLVFLHVPIQFRRMFHCRLLSCVS
jgi:hypothetical protein